MIAKPAMPPAAVGTVAYGNRPDLLILDPGVDDATVLAATATRACRIVTLDGGRGGLTALAATIAAAGPAAAIHVVSHGAPGRLRLSGVDLTLDDIERRPVEIAALARVLAGTPLLLYGCALAAGEAGQRFVAGLASALGVPVRASTKAVGCAALGGSWILDVGRSPAEPLFDADRAAPWHHLLTLITSTADSGAGTFRTAAAAVPGDLTLNFNALAGTPTVSLSTGTVTIGDGSSAIVSFRVTGGTDNLTIGGDDIALALAGNTLVMDGSGTPLAVTINSNITGNGTLLIGDGDSALTVTLGGANTFVSSSGIGNTAGPVSIRVTSDDTLVIADDSALGTGKLSLSRGILSVTGATTIDNAIHLDNNGGTLNITADVTISGTISGSSGNSLTKTGASVLTLSGANTYTGLTSVSVGTLKLSGGSALADGGSVSVSAGATLDVNGTTETIGTLSGAGNIALGAGTLTVAQIADATFSGVISGSGNLVKSGVSTLTLSGNNTYTGTTTVSAGSLSVSADSNIGAGTIVLNGGTLAVTGATTIDNAIALGAGNGTVSLSADATFSGVMSGTGGFTKSGTGALTLSGSNTYTGTTTISAGTLRLTGGSALADSATVSVDAGATLDLNGSTETIGTLTGSGTVSLGSGSIVLANSATSSFSGTLTGTGAFTVASGVTLGGTGTYASPVTVLSGGVIAPGNSPGIIATGNLTLAAGSTASMEIDGATAGTGYDQITVTGTVDVSGATLVTSIGYASATGDRFILISNDGTDAVTGTFAGLNEGDTFVTGGRIYRISYADGDGNDVALTNIGTYDSDAPINGSDNDEVLFGTNNVDAIRGYGGADTVYGLDSGDTLSGGAGSDRLFGNAGSDVLYGNAAGDELRGNEGADTLFGGQGSDLLYGNQAGDVVYGNLAADTIYGGQAADSAFGGQGDDVIYGNNGGDVLRGNLGDDTLYGGQEADTLTGGAGDDMLIGGAGADRIALADGSGADTVVGFSHDEGDVVAVAANVNGIGLASVSDLLARLAGDADGNAVLDLGNGNTVTLMGVPPTGLTAADFALA